MYRHACIPMQKHVNRHITAILSIARPPHKTGADFLTTTPATLIARVTHVAPITAIPFYNNFVHLFVLAPRLAETKGYNICKGALPCACMQQRTDRTLGSQMPPIISVSPTCPIGTFIPSHGPLFPMQSAAGRSRPLTALQTARNLTAWEHGFVYGLAPVIPLTVSQPPQNF